MHKSLLLLAGLAGLLPAGAAQAQTVSFGPATAYVATPASDWATYQLEMADVNSDDRLNVLTTNYALAAAASVLPGTSTGTLQAAATFTVGPANA